MARRLLAALAALLTLGLGAATLGLLWAHLEMRGLDPELPDPEALWSPPSSSPLPVRIHVLDTARQPMPRRLVLEPGLDRHPDAPYEMSHPAFLLEWPDGRALLVDAGMDREGALAFGRPLEWAGAGPISPRRSVAEAWGAALAGRPVGVVFTHLHPDHVEGAVALCAALPAGSAIRWLQTSLQAERTNYTTRPGRALLEKARCLVPERLADAPLAPLPGFPGVFVMRTAGHTPGSQAILAWVEGAAGVRGYLFVGDAANAADGIFDDVPKPRLYRWLVVPESEPRQRRVRRFLRAAARGPLQLVVSHDGRYLDSSGIPVWDE
jgi:glyoxylase-like metal-dependent hydrolase (beta-lactamase superfamily II)